MHPVIRQRLAGQRLALRAFAFMVGKRQILTAAMDINRIAQKFASHGRALDMPAGASVSPRAVPENLSRLRRLPQHEVFGMLLARIDLDADAELQLLQILAGQLAVALELSRTVEDIPAALVSVAFVHQFLDKFDDQIHALCHARIAGGRAHAESLVVL